MQTSAKEHTVIIVTLILKLNVSIVETFVSLIQKHSDCKNFEEVTTKLTKTHSVTLAICKTCDDLVAKTPERRLLNVRNLVAAEARYHVPLKSCPKVREERSPNINTKIHVI